MEESGRDAAAPAPDPAQAEQVQARLCQEHGNQEVWSWGAGTDGQLGTGIPQDAYTPQGPRHLSLVTPLPHRISHLSCGGAHVIALTSCGKVATWGRGTSGQLGHGDVANRLRPELVLSLERCFIAHASAGWNHSGFVSDSGKLFTCGDGSFGQLGHGDYRPRRFPVEVSFFGSKHVKEIACGMRHSLVLVRDNCVSKVYGVGAGKRGQLGISEEKIKSCSLPQQCLGLQGLNIVTVIANGDHSAALTADGQVYTWGRGFSGTLDSPSPWCLRSRLSFTQVAIGWNHALLLTGERDLFMLGGYRHERKKPVNDELREEKLVKVPGPDGKKIMQIAAGAEHSALVTENGQVGTWGWGEHGQLGLGNTRDQTHPQVVDVGCRAADEDRMPVVYCGSGFTFTLL